jgi:D-alanyl-lipoteichoic acid acyltransferase DltB (MBOAT superfamily)
MLFNSLEFLIFFPVVLIIYHQLSFRFRGIFLLLASYYFYMSWNPTYIILILASTIVDYYSALQIGNSDQKHIKKFYLILSIIVNLGLLFTFKYFDFFSTSVQTATNSLGFDWEMPMLNVLLPVGISFYTFQTMSYTIDIYRGRFKPEKNFIYFALYVSYFPQLVAGPIERGRKLLPQLKRENQISIEDVYFGLNKIAYGFFKKVVVADNVAVYVDSVYADPSAYSGVTLFIATFFFFIQLYCDFSGYSDIAIGCARLMGVKLSENFNRPFLATSITDFWQRWHISLSNWLRDYVYASLRGHKKRGRWATYSNLLITFTLCGLWHGAAWTFVLFGVAHGAMLALESFLNEIKFGKSFFSSYPRTKHTFNVLKTLIIVTLTGTFFRAESITDCFLIWTKLASFSTGFSLVDFYGGLKMGELALCFLVFFMLVLSYLLPKDLKFKSITFLVVTSVIIMMFGSNSEMQFVYFQF